jgi:biotin--protein ligase
MDVLVYHPDLNQDTSIALLSIRALLSPFYTVQSVSTLVLASHPWAKSCALLVLLPPAGSEETVKISPKCLFAMQSYAESGGRVLALGFGASSSHSTAQPDTLNFRDPTSPVYFSLLRSASLGTTDVGRIVGVSTDAPSVGKQAVRLPDGVPHIAFWANDHGIGDVKNPAATKIRIGHGEIYLWNFSLAGTPAPALQAVLKLALAHFYLFKTDEPAVSQASDLPPVPNSPLPQFLLSPQSKPHVIATVLRSIGIQADASFEPVVFKDVTDTFIFHFLSSAETIQLISRVRSALPTPSNVPRDLVVLPAGILPPREATPRFDADKFFAELESVSLCSSEDQHWRMGEALLYGEAVTSTQTLLERSVRMPS